MSSNFDKVVNAFREYYGRNPGVERRSDIIEAARAYNVKVPSEVWKHKESRGMYNISVDSTDNTAFANVTTSTATNEDDNVVPMNKTNSTEQAQQSISTIPKKDPNFIRWGIYSSIKKIVKSDMFLPTLISGHNGNGKTESVVQACAEMKRPVYRVNFTQETDEDDMIGSWALVDGNTVWRDGPVIQAMKTPNAILLLDELDRASNKVMALQSVLEGNPYYNKKTGEIVYPSDGFNIIATANTKGKGSDDGRYSAANVLDEALLDRFSLAFEQGYPNKKTEYKILHKYLSNTVEDEITETDEGFLTTLVDWVDSIRQTYAAGGIEDIISTRRAVDIVKTYIVLGRTAKVQKKAVDWAIARFDEDTKGGFEGLWKQMQKSESTFDPNASEEDGDDDSEEV